MPIELPALFRQSWSSPGNGDAYMVPVFGGSGGVGWSRKLFVPKLAGEIPIRGARRVYNMTDGQLNQWPVYTSSKTLTCGLAEGVPPPPGLDVPVYRLQIFGQSTGTAVVYSPLAATRRSQRRVISLYARSANGSVQVCNLRTAGHIWNGQYFWPGNEWVRVANLGTNKDHVYEIGVHEQVDQVDIYIAGVMAEEVPDSQWGPSEYTQRSRDYGFGALGVRYFDSYCVSTTASGAVAVEGVEGQIPDIVGLIPISGKTNLLPYGRIVAPSSDGNIGYVGSTIIVNSAGIAPDGTETATAVHVANSTSGFWVAYSINNPGVRYTQGLFVKWVSGTESYIMGFGGGLFGSNNTGHKGGSINVKSGFVISADSGATIRVTPVGNGWHHYQLTMLSGSDATIGGNILYNYSGASGSVLVWGAQVDIYDSIVGLTLTDSGAVGVVNDAAVLPAVPFGGRFSLAADVYVPSEGLDPRIAGRQIIIGAQSYHAPLYLRTPDFAVGLWDNTAALVEIGSVTTGINRLALAFDHPNARIVLNGIGQNVNARSLNVGSMSYAFNLNQWAVGPGDMGNVGLLGFRYWPNDALSLEQLLYLTSSAAP